MLLRSGIVTSTSDVNVLAKDNTDIDSILAVVAGGIGADGGGAGGAASDTTILSRNVTAEVENAIQKSLNADKLTVNAINTADVLTSASGLSIAGGLYGAGAVGGVVSVAKLDGNTIASVSGITGTNNGFEILAEHDTKLEVYSNAGAAAAAIGGGTLGMAVTVVNDGSKTEAILEDSNIKHNDNTAEDLVAASNTTAIISETGAASVAISIGGAGSGTVGINNFDSYVGTKVLNTTIGSSTGSKAKTFFATAENNIDTTFINANVTGGMVGLGVGVGVNTIDTSVVTNVSGSNIYAEELVVNAEQNLDVDQHAAAATAGGIGLGASVMITNKIGRASCRERVYGLV